MLQLIKDWPDTPDSTSNKEKGYKMKHKQVIIMRKELFR